MAGNDEFIEFVIKPDGSIEMELEGFKGNGCAEVAAEMIKKLGRSADSKKTPEYYQREQKQTCVKRKI